ncbi:hypothetical protein DICPUDRAFT_41394 [Dictyostelium purpureum]|uniref:SAM-dependent MTase RsmB/NOP-type domain-containing protein n=1 Tax=Dictyostelium purpureum TaxID=5786 RepID=F1A009_DICPU|nr:uncharacterized protein DICPUDRAFT_41394 [Dictyostelium purpureum]EGC30470.1 hypothetical protein DICPUDRAFT_41394 [Dictyostelium purpureum]|eukprot:XP_003292999.1 hypothetical protein DICPUDRAFT_41394 [Dictyostelium purpureum]
MTESIRFDIKRIENEMNIINFKGNGDQEFNNDSFMEFKDQEVYNHLLKYYGKERMEQIQKSMTDAFLYTTIRVNSKTTNKAQLKKDMINHFEENERNLENRNHFKKLLEFNEIINSKSPSTTNEIEKQILNDTLFIKNEKNLKTPLPIYPQIIVDIMCGEAVLRGSHIFSVGILASNKYIKKGDMVSVFVNLDSLVLKGSIIEGVFKEKSAFVGNGISLLDRSEYNNTKTGVGIEMTERLFFCPPLNGVLEQNMFLQHLPSLMTVYQLEPKLGDRILDMCAAPGGKTTLIASLIQQQFDQQPSNNSTEIIALDKNKGKVKKVLDLCKKLSLDSFVKCYSRDSSKLLKEHQQDPSDKVIFKEGSFDKILLDGPCSGLGSKPRFIETSKLIDLQNCSDFQKKLLDVAVGLLKEGGTLVYSTCTINPEENELNVAYVLNKYPNMKLVEQTPHISQIGLENCGLDDQQRKLVQRYDPSDANIGTIGFFISKFIKN